MKTKLLAAAMAVGLSVVGWSQSANALFINNGVGLASPTNVVTFDGTGFPANTVITNQFAAQGVTISPFLRIQPSSLCGGCTGFANDFLANFFPVASPTDFTLQFGMNVNEAAFAMADQNNLWTFEARLGAAVVDSASLVVPGVSGVGFVGFTGVVFDNIRVFTAGSNTAMALDTLQFSKVPVPEPGTLAIMGLGLAGLGFARRRKAA